MKYAALMASPTTSDARKLMIVRPRIPLITPKITMLMIPRMMESMISAMMRFGTSA